MKRTEQEFRYLMGFHQLDSVPISYRGQDVGKVTADLKYEYGYGSHLTHDRDAVDLALEQLDSWIEKVGKYRSKEQVTLLTVTHNEHSVWEYADEDGTVRHHTFPITVDDKTTAEVTGTYDEIFAKVYRRNSRMRYCNGCSTEFANPQIQQLYLGWHDYIPRGRSMDIYYGGGIVD